MTLSHRGSGAGRICEQAGRAGLTWEAKAGLASRCLLITHCNAWIGRTKNITSGYAGVSVLCQSPQADF